MSDKERQDSKGARRFEKIGVPPDAPAEVHPKVKVVLTMGRPWPTLWRRMA